MTRKNNRNLLGVIALIAMCAFMLISCPQLSTPAKENPRELTLNYDGKSKSYYYLNGKWYSDRECKKVVEKLKLEEPNPQTALITVNFNSGTPQSTGEGYFQDGKNEFKWKFAKYVKDGDESKADYFGGGELKLPENGISENVTLTAEYDTKEVVRKLPELVKEGVTFGGYRDNDTNETVEADTPITVTPGLIATYEAIWASKTFNTLTLDIAGQQQKLYYGEDGAWYKALSEGGLLIDDNKVTGDDVKFNIPSAPTWTVTFNKNTPAGASDSDFTITPASVDVTPALSLSDDSFIDKATGKVSVDSIDGDKVITGTYPPTIIGKSVTVSSTNTNYEFEKWTANGKTIDNIADYEVSGKTEIVANWKNLSDFKVLTIKDGGVVKDTAYYNTTYNKWYKERSTTSEVKTSVALPDNKTKRYTITLDYDNDGRNETRSEEVTSSFLGYGLDDNTSEVIKPDGLLKDYTIKNDTVLVSKWDEVKFTQPENPTRDGYTFNGWYNGDDECIFDSVVTEDITLTAHWTQKTYKTLTLNIDGQEQKLYYGSDNAWYKALSEGGLLIDDNKVTGENVKFTIPSAPVWTVTFDKNPISGMNNSEITITPASVDVTPELSLSDDSYVNKITGKVLLNSINEDKIVTGIYPSKAIGKSVTASYTNVNYEFAGWMVNGVTTTDIATCAVRGNTTIKATWKNISEFKVLTVKDGESVKDTAYYNATDKKWYVDEKMTGEKTSVNIPEVQEKEYTITFNTDGDSTIDPVKAKSSFLGYGIGSPAIGSDGSLSGYTIDKDTELVSLWSDATFNKPVQPTKDGYVFEAWYNGDFEYNFDNVVTGDMTLTAHWTQKTYKTLTLNITDSNAQTLYYGSDDAWYKALIEDQLLLDRNKITGDDVKFNIPSAPVWTVSFDKNPISGMNDSEITIAPASVDVTPELSLSDDSYINKITGKVLPGSIIENVTITGTYPPTAIGADVTASYPNVNYVFAGWTLNGKTIDNIADYEVSGDTEIVANWNNMSSFKTLTVKDGDVVKDTVYYNVTDNKWYKDENMTGEKTSVNLPEVQEKEYTITFNTDGGSTIDPVKAKSSFLGYRTNDNTSPAIGTNGSLSGYTIDKDTELVSLWSDATFNKPAQPIKDGYVFDKWTSNDTEYNFNNAVTEDITLVAVWTKKTYKTLKLDITDSDAQTLYYGSDGAWYKALSGDLLLDVNKVEGEDVKFNIPSAPVWTVTFDKNVPNGASESEFTITPDSVDVTPDLTLTPANTVDASSGKVLAASINSNTIVVGKYPPTAIGEKALELHPLMRTMYLQVGRQMVLL